MKKYYKTISIFLCIIVCLLITGCTCVCKDKETIFTIQDYVAVNGETCLKYIEADSALKGRDKEAYRARHKKMQNLVDKYFSAK